MHIIIISNLKLVTSISYDIYFYLPITHSWDTNMIIGQASERVRLTDRMECEGDALVKHQILFE